MSSCVFYRLIGSRVKFNGLILFPWFELLILIFIYFITFLTETFSSMFWFWFLVFVEFFLVFGFVIFLCSFILLNLNVMQHLHHAFAVFGDQLLDFYSDSTDWLQ